MGITLLCTGTLCACMKHQACEIRVILNKWILPNFAEDFLDVLPMISSMRGSLSSLHVSVQNVSAPSHLLLFILIFVENFKSTDRMYRTRCFMGLRLPLP